MKTAIIISELEQNSIKITLDGIKSLKCSEYQEREFIFKVKIHYPDITCCINETKSGSDPCSRQNMKEGSDPGLKKIFRART